MECAILRRPPFFLRKGVEYPFDHSGGNLPCKYGLLGYAGGPRDLWRPVEDAAAIECNTLNMGGCKGLGGLQEISDLAFRAITLKTTDPSVDCAGRLSFRAFLAGCFRRRIGPSDRIGDDFLAPGWSVA